MKYYFTVIVILMGTCCFAQSADTLYFKDGSALGGKQEMITGCITGINNKIAQSGLNVNAEAACICMLDVIAANNTLKSFTAASKKKNEDVFAALVKEGSPTYNEAIKCVLDNVVANPKKKQEEVPDAPKQEGGGATMGPEMKKSFLEGCISESSKTKEFKQLKIDAKEYCNCTWTKIIEKNVPINELEKLGDPNSELFQEIILPCITEAAKGKK